ncbi:MAG: ROK family protein [Candidatus Scatosoma sp.]
MKKYVIGIDLGGMSAKGAIFEENGTLILKQSVPTRPEDGFEGTVAKMANLCRDLAKSANADFSAVDGIGMAVPGYMNSETGVVVRWANFGWEQVPLVERMNALTGKPVKIANDANVAALGEAKFGAGKEYQSCLLVTLGTGVGGGVIIDGKLFEGYMGAGAEIGHMVICEGGELCTCGRHGCLEAYTSATALIRFTKWKMQLDLTTKMWEVAGGKLDNVDGKTAFIAAKEGDMRGKEIVDEYVEHLAVGLANLANVLRPEAILLGGGVSNEGEFLFKPLRVAVEKKLYTSAKYVPLKIEKASLGNDAGVYGAFALARGI